VSSNTTTSIENSQEFKEKKKAKAVALLSGGLDSNLAVRMMLEQGIEVEAIAIKTPFCDFDCGRGCGHRVKEVASELGVQLKTVYYGEEYLKMLKHPKYGYGSGMNPCIDCRGMMYKTAKQHMEKIGADFVITGEVLFQRPMSQNKRALNIIEKEAEMEGKVLRPLSAKHLTPTEAEKYGLVERSKLGDVRGRSRKSQIALANYFNINDPPNAAGGCLLTDPAFSKRIRDLMEHSKYIPSINEVELLKIGRHFRLSPEAKLVVGRDEDENDMIEAMIIDGDIKMEASEYVGPKCILRCKKCDNRILSMAARTVLRYSDAPRGNPSKVKVEINGLQQDEISALPANETELEGLRI
jgi:tRNA-uridine 2-sulfurtransferase